MEEKKKKTKIESFKSTYCQGEKCKCGNDATHKVAEVIFDDDPLLNRHELTTYVCEEHFKMIFSL